MRLRFTIRDLLWLTLVVALLFDLALAAPLQSPLPAAWGNKPVKRPVHFANAVRACIAGQSAGGVECLSAQLDQAG